MYSYVFYATEDALHLHATQTVQIFTSIEHIPFFYTIKTDVA